MRCTLFRRFANISIHLNWTNVQFSSVLMGRPKTASKYNVPLNIRSKSKKRRIGYLINIVDVWNLNECLVISADCDIIGLDIIE